MNLSCAVFLALLCSAKVVVAQLAQSPSDTSFISRCSYQLDKTCALQVFGYIFQNLTSITSKCCRELVYSLGWECHDDWVQYHITRPSFHGNASDALAKSEQVWDTCVATAGPAPSPTTY
ncbi:Protein of unknown function (DUF784) [Quillaja saponaria]|uniref:Prolamin-like domain-containing protein n=1 Tax=Quillaja saponaria TaxID=32244 RepID=A0AAD7KN15_QUISA|nr:Protein of unknown function (DUF784) [Quillaja saponaria]